MFLLVAILAVGGCGESGTEPPTAPPEPPRPTQVAVRPAEARLAALDATVQLTPEVRDQNGQIMSGATVAWTSSDAVVARVNASGLVAAVGNGSATITAAVGGVTGTMTVTVEQEVAALTVRPEALAFRALGDTLRMVAEAVDANGNSWRGARTVDVEWASSDAAVVHVDAAGLVTAVGNGSATITASVGGATGTAAVTVEQEVAAIAVDPEALTFRALGDTLRLVAEVADANGHPIYVEQLVGVEWASSDATVVHVDAAGLMTAVGNGPATITASAGGVMGTATVTVEQEATTLTLRTGTILFQALGDTLRLVAEAADANGHPMEVEWTSSDAAVARVDAAGLVTAVGNGSATITVAAGAAVRSAVVAVEQVAVVFELAPEAVYFRAFGDTLRLVVEAADANGHPVAVTWMSSDAAVAAVDPSGLVASRGNGSARITATASGAVAGATVTVAQEAVALGGLPEADTLLWYGDPGDTLRLVVTGAVDANGHPVEGVLDESAAVAWSTSPFGVATVDDGGLVRGTGEGVAGITATAADLGLSASTKLTVINRDRAALVAFYHATGGPGWQCNENWITHARMETWCGVGTRIRNDGVVMVTELKLPGNSLAGPIPPELGNLANLGSLDLGHNQLTGPIPRELASLTDLRQLWLGGNRLTGVIPRELGNLSNLYSLFLFGNQLTGSIPSALASLAHLRQLSLFDNRLTGVIPRELGDLANLTTLNLGGNRLTGPVPPELASLARLRQLSLDDNQFTGAIPSELASLPHLERLSLRSNQLTGAIPRELGDLANLTSLHLGGNQLTGPIPRELASLTHLRQLWLAGNRLTGAIPRELGDLTNLISLVLANNQLTGPIPPELANLARLRQLSLFGNRLTGAIPRELGDLANLTSLVLVGNRLTGAIPGELGGLANLNSLWLADNQLVGPIPPNLGNLANLRSLHLDGNATLTGRLPETLTQLQLEAFYWHNTQLCHPPTTAFQQWLQSIRDHQGRLPCGS